MALNSRVVTRAWSVVCDECGFATPERPSSAEAHEEAKRLGFQWISTNSDPFSRKDLCKRCFAKVSVTEQAKDEVGL